ncbi:MAG: hypothetical protein GX321_00725 [Clostridiales bacterium]|nr:hypothetical protein [Clostridiales bacterium]
MNKKLFKKIITAVLTAALLISSNGVASLNASATEKVPVEGVYANFLKATMATGTSRQIRAYVQPENATVQDFSYYSSAPKVANVSDDGLITALSPGKATITIKAIDGSRQTETIDITVLNDLLITGDFVDSDNEVIVLDKTYGNLTIDSSVGDATIYLSGINIKNKLTMDSGEYSVAIYDSVINELVIEDVQGEIESFAVKDDEDKAPSLQVGENTEVSKLMARVSASIRQEDGSEIEGIEFTQDADGKITIYLENYSGGLILDASLGDIEIVSTGCNLDSVTVKGNENAGNVTLSNGGDSEISNLKLTGAAKVNLAIPTNEATIDNKANGASLTASEGIGSLNNEGLGSSVLVTGTGSIDNLNANGEKAKIEVAAGGYVGTANLNGASNLLTGAGDVAEAYVNANNVSVDTVNTLVTIGKVEGTKVQGNDVAGETSVETKPPVGGGGGFGPGSGEQEPEEEYTVGYVIVNNNFDNGMNDLRSVQGGSTIKVIDSGEPERGYVAYVSDKAADWAGAGIDLGKYLKKHITISISAKIKAEGTGNIMITVKKNGNQFAGAGSVSNVPANTWTDVSGTFELDNTINEAVIYFETTGNYFVDDFKIVISDIGEPIPVTGVTLSKSAITIGKGATATLTATVQPANADQKGITWSSADPSIAMVDTNGVVQGVSAGTTRITAKTVDGNFTASCTVTVKATSMSMNRATYSFMEADETMQLSASITGIDDTTITWESSDSNVATVDANGLVTAKTDGLATITARAADDSTMSCKVSVYTGTTEELFVADFEDGGTANLAKIYGSGNMRNDVVAGYTGEKALYFYDRSDAAHGPRVELLKVGNANVKKYEKTPQLIHVSAWVLYTDPTGGDTQEFMIQKRSDYSAIATKSIKVGEWTYISGTFNLNDADNVGLIDFKLSSSANTSFYIDNFIFAGVIEEVKEVTGVTINKSTLSLAKGKTEKLTLTVSPFTTDHSVVWTSSDDAIASVSADGTVTAVEVGGPVTITATVTDNLNGKTFTVTSEVTVTEPPTEPEPYFTEFKLSDEPASFSLTQGTTQWDPANTTASKDFYLNGNNFKNRATACGITDPLLLDKFTSWEGVYEIVKGYEYTITITGGKSMGAGTNLKAEIIVQNNQTVGGYNGTWLTVSHDLGVEEVSADSPITITDQFIFGDKKWNGDDIEALKIAVRILGIDESTTVTGTFDVTVLPNPGTVALVEVTGISLDKTEILLPKNDYVTLKATVAPKGYTTANVVTWSSSDDDIATVDANGKVTAVADTGTATITATIVDDVSGKTFTATCEVTVTEESLVKAEDILFDFEDIIPEMSSIGLNYDVITATDMVTAIAPDFATPSDKMLKVVNGAYNSIPVLNITLPEGKTLADYNKLEVKYYGVASTDTGWKPAFLLVGETISYTGFNLSEAPEFMAMVNNGFTGQGTWNTLTIDLDSTKAAAVTGSAIQIGLGMSAPNDATFILDDITLVGVSGSAIVADFEDGVNPVVGFAGEKDVATSIITQADFASMILGGTEGKVLELTNTNWGQAVKLKVNLVEGTKIADYTKLSFRLYMPKTVSDEQGFTYKDFTINLGETVSATTDDFKFETMGQQGSWITVEKDLTPEMIEAVGDALTFEIALGCNTNTPSSYYIDDVKLTAKE